MIMGKCGAVIGWQRPITWKFREAHKQMRVLQPVTASYFPMIIKSYGILPNDSEKLQWLTPPTLALR